VSIIYVLIPLAIIIVGIAIGVFFWAVKSNQFEDLDRQGYSILFDDDIKSESSEKTNDAVDSDANEQQVEFAKDKKEPKR
jgi:cbb3-type cytochrome oxidase maturation protein